MDSQTDTRLIRLLIGWPAIGHENIQVLLCFLRVRKVAGFQHLAPVPDHLIDIDRIDLAVVGALDINFADIFVLVRKFS